MAKNNKQPAKAQCRKPAYTVYARINTALGAVLDGFVNETRPKTTNTAVVEMALEEFFERRGLWPPPDAE